MKMTRLLGGILLSLFMAGAASAAPAAPPGGAPKNIKQRLAELTKTGLVFYVAKGPAGSCGEGCDTWIAAEGQFDAAAPERLRRLLKQLGSRQLPIYFYSPGGLVAPSLEMGRLLRRLKMTAGVGATIARACATDKLDDVACRKLKQAGADVQADLVESGATCASACVYALLGATTRLVAPGARLGVHTPMIVTRYSDGRTVTVTGGKTNSSLAEATRYVTEMGIDGALMKVVARTSFEDIRILNRDEISGYRIDTREFSETNWRVARGRGTRMVAYKMIVQIDPKNETFIIRTFGIGCADYSNNLMIRYQFDTRTDLIDLVKIDMGGAAIRLNASTGRVSEGKESREGFITAAAIGNAAQSKSIDIAETAEAVSHQVKLSTIGLSDALERVIKSCGPVAMMPVIPMMPLTMPKSPSGL
jgi:hypothetical protein